MGSKNDDVRTLQTMLNLAGYVVSIDGIFGAETDAAVRVFQSRNGLVVDGIVGSNTWNALTAATQPGGIPTYIPNPVPKTPSVIITPSGPVPSSKTPGDFNTQVIYPTSKPTQASMGNMWLYIAIGAIIYYYSKQQEVGA